VKVARRAAETLDQLKERIVDLEGQLENERGARKDAEIRISFGNKQLTAERTHCAEMVSSASSQVRGLNQRPLELARKIHQAAMLAKENAKQCRPVHIDASEEMEELRRELAAERAGRRKQQATHSAALAKLKEELAVEQELRADAQAKVAALEQRVAGTVRAAQDVRLMPSVATDTAVSHQLEVQAAAMRGFCSTLGDAITDNKLDRRNQPKADDDVASPFSNPESPSFEEDRSTCAGSDGPVDVTMVVAQPQCRSPKPAATGRLTRHEAGTTSTSKLGVRRESESGCGASGASFRQRSPVVPRAKPTILRNIPSASRLPNARVKVH
jgi:septal ring factor EnvC (AmiA/AmiB activator)